MSDIVSATPVRSNLAQMLLQLKELPADVVSDGLNKFVALDKTPQFLKEVKVEAAEGMASSSDNDEQFVQKISATEDTCNCRKSRCLKLYCQCFAARILCTASCNCEACANTAIHIDLRREAIKGIMDRNPNAFDSKFKAPTINNSGGNGAHKTGCRCRKSMCLKKYCECFQLGVPCSPICTCLHCCNTADGAAFAGKATQAAAKMSHIRKLGDGFSGSMNTSGEGDDLLRAASDLAQMKRETSHSGSGSSEDGSYRSSSPLSVGEADCKPKSQGRKIKKQNFSANHTRGQLPHSPRIYIDGSMPASSNSPGPTMLSVLPPPRSLVIRAPPLSLPSGKRQRDGALTLDEMSPKSGGCSPNVNRLPKPSILNRPKSCPGNSSKFEGLDSSVYRSRSPVLGTPGSELQYSTVPARSGLTARSASPNTMHVATALSLLCGLTGLGGNKSPDTFMNSAPISSSGGISFIMPTGSPVVPVGIPSAAPRPHSGSLGDRMDVTSEEDFSEISPAFDAEHLRHKSITVNIPPPIYESGESERNGTAALPVVNFDQLSAGDGADPIGESVLNVWASPAVQVDRLSSWSQPAVDLPRTPPEPSLYARESQRTTTPIGH